MSNKNNIYDGISDSIKAKLYDFTYTPFMSSFVISWVIINNKYLIVYFSEIDIDKKLSLLNIYGKKTVGTNLMDDSILPFFYFLEMGSHFFWYPFGIAIFYVFCYPHISHIFYKYTGEMNNKKKSIKLEYEKKLPVSAEEKEAIYLENYSLTTKINELKIKMVEMEKQYEKEISNQNTDNFNLKNRNNELHKKLEESNDKVSKNNQMADKITYLEKELIEKNKLIEDSSNYKDVNETLKKEKISLSTTIEENESLIKQLRLKIAELTKENASLTKTKNSELLKKETDFMQKFNIDKDELAVLKVIYTKSINSNYFDGYVSDINKHLNWTKLKLETVINNLNLKGIISKSQMNICDIDKNYAKNIVKLFEEEE